MQVNQEVLVDVAQATGVDKEILERVVRSFRREDTFVVAFRRALLVDGVDLLNRHHYKKALSCYIKNAKPVRYSFTALVATTTWASILIATGVRMVFRSTTRINETLRIEDVAYMYVSRDEHCVKIDTTDEDLVKQAAEVARLAMNKRRREPKHKRKPKAVR
jgi:hypothetical protein